MFPWLFNVYIDTLKMGIGRRGESGDYLASCMQMTWFCMVSHGRPEGNGGMIY